jgi:hypothetical protein
VNGILFSDAPAFVRSFVRSLKDQEFRALFILVAALLIGGTVFYSSVDENAVSKSVFSFRL